MVHVVGHGTRSELGGYTPRRLANIISRLSFRETKIGHVSLVACKIYHPDDKNHGYLNSLLKHLVLQYNIQTTISAWTTEVAVDPQGRLLSRINGTSWYMNYPGSVVIARIVDTDGQFNNESLEAGYDTTEKDYITTGSSNANGIVGSDVPYDDDVFSFKRSFGSDAVVSRERNHFPSIESGCHKRNKKFNPIKTTNSRRKRYKKHKKRRCK